MLLTLTFWHWIILGVGLLILELVSGGGFLLWVGLAAIITAVIVFVLPFLSWPWQLVFFSIMSILNCSIWYYYLKKEKEDEAPQTLNKRAAQYIGREFELETKISHGRGRVKIGDSLWRVAGEDMEAGATVKVVSVDGVILNVEKSS